MDWSVYIQQITIDFQTQGWQDIVAFVTGVLYVVLAAHNQRSCWIWGFISTVLITYMSAYVYHLYADAVLNAFYAVMAIIGWREWGRHEEANGAITRLSRGWVIKVLWLCVIGSLFASELLIHFTDAVSPRLDVLTSVCSVIATIWMVKRYVQGWWIWIATNAAYIYLYTTSGAMYFAVLMVVYLLLSIYGLARWRHAAAR